MDQQTIEVYDARAQEYADAFSGDEPNRYLKEFVDRVPLGGHVLDFGCGPGSDAALMMQLGLNVSAIDASEKMVEAARSRNVNAQQSTFDDLTDTSKYDGVWANFSLLHAPREKLPENLRAIHRALRSGGIFHIGMKTGENSRRDRIGRSCTYYGPMELNDMLAAAGFTILNQSTGESPGLDGTVAPWVILLCKRND